MKQTTRFEYKYYISHKDYVHMKPIVESLLQPDKNSKAQGYPVHSIYFDDLIDTGAADKAFGNEYHKKYRIRYYHDSSRKKLECKEKVGDVSTKYSVSLTTELEQALLHNDIAVLKQHFSSPLIRKFTLDTLRFHYTPRLQIEYQREAFTDEQDSVRITFDHYVRTSARFEDERPVFIPLVANTHMILEIKYNTYLPKPLKQLFQSYSVVPFSISKYFMAYTALQP